jgi:hypothetical protein
MTDLDIILQLQTPAGRDAIVAATQLEPVEPDYLRHLAALRKRFDDRLARAALDIAILRRRARARFGETADDMFFTREALEQASHPAVSAWRARRYAGHAVAVDLACSCGVDTLHLARHVETVVGIDRDELRVAMARLNARASGRRCSFVVADLEAGLPLRLDDGTALFVDPGRRRNGRRVRSIRDYLPPLSLVEYWRDDFPALGAKIAPAVRMREIAGLDCEVEFISYKGELREAVLWFGPLRDVAVAGERDADGTAPGDIRNGHGVPVARRATVLPGPHTMTGNADDADVAIDQPKDHLIEPDPAVIRAGLVTTLAQLVGATKIDADIAFLTSERPARTPFARSWPIEAAIPFHLKKLRAYLRERNVGRVTVKKRGSPVEVDRFTRDLKLEGDEERLLALTHVAGKPTAIVCDPAQDTAHP